MSKESKQAGLGVRFHSLPARERGEREETTARRARAFEPEAHDLERLLPRLRERQRRMA